MCSTALTKPISPVSSPTHRAFQDQVNDRRLTYLLQQTQAVRGPKADGALILDDTLCEHVGSLFDYVDRHYNHGDATYPLAHNPVTSHYVSGPVRFPVDLRLYRRYEECTRWEEFVRSHFPAGPIPTQKKERARLHKEVDPVLLQAPDFEKLHQQFRTKIALGIELLESAIAHKVPFSVLLFDSWYLADELVSMARYHKKDWISLLNCFGAQVVRFAVLRHKGSVDRLCRRLSACPKEGKWPCPQFRSAPTNYDQFKRLK